MKHIVYVITSHCTGLLYHLNTLYGFCDSGLWTQQVSPWRSMFCSNHKSPWTTHNFYGFLYVLGTWQLFGGNFVFQDLPHIFDMINVWIVSRPREHIDVIGVQEVLCQLQYATWPSIQHKNCALVKTCISLHTIWLGGCLILDVNLSSKRLSFHTNWCLAVKFWIVNEEYITSNFDGPGLMLHCNFKSLRFHSSVSSGFFAGRHDFRQKSKFERREILIFDTMDISVPVL